MQGAWYQYPYDQNFGQYPDSQGNYAKPDANFYGVPSGTPITALASGVVTSVRRQPWGPLAYSVTVQMDNAYNSVAKYTAYNYVSSPVVSVGQRVNVGDTLAYSGNPYGIGTAFAFSDKPVYGTSSSNEPFSGSYVNPALNPVPFLQSVIPSGGSGGELSTILNNTLNSSGTTPNNANSSPNSFLGVDLTRFIDAMLLFIIGLTLVIVGTLLLVGKLGTETASNPGVQDAAKVAVAA